MTSVNSNLTVDVLLMQVQQQVQEGAAKDVEDAQAQVKHAKEEAKALRGDIDKYEGRIEDARDRIEDEGEGDEQRNPDDAREPRNGAEGDAPDHGDDQQKERGGVPEEIGESGSISFQHGTFPSAGSVEEHVEFVENPGAPWQRQLQRLGEEEDEKHGEPPRESHADQVVGIGDHETGQKQEGDGWRDQIRSAAAI